MLEDENRRLKTIVADLTLENKVLRDVNSKKWRAFRRKAARREAGGGGACKGNTCFVPYAGLRVVRAFVKGPLRQLASNFCITDLWIHAGREKLRPTAQLFGGGQGFAEFHGGLIVCCGFHRLFRLKLQVS